VREKIYGIASLRLVAIENAGRVDETPYHKKQTQQKPQRGGVSRHLRIIFTSSEVDATENDIGNEVYPNGTRDRTEKVGTLLNG
jgi:hypothetical protein